MNRQAEKHIKSFHCDHATACHACKKEITPSEFMYVEGRKEFCSTCGAQVKAAWVEYYKRAQ